LIRIHYREFEFTAARQLVLYSLQTRNMDQTGGTERTSAVELECERDISSGVIAVANAEYQTLSIVGDKERNLSVLRSAAIDSFRG
jgi:hypothetical protein